MVSSAEERGGEGERGCEGEAADGEAVPVAGVVAWEGVEHGGGGEAAEGSDGRSGAGGAGEAAFFFEEGGLGLGAGGAEAEFAIEPECAGVEAFGVIVAELVGVDDEVGDAEQLVAGLEDAGVEPGGFAVAEGEVEVEAGLHAFAEGEAFEVAGGDAVFPDGDGVIGAEGEAVWGEEGGEEEFDAAAGVDFGE